MYLHRIVEFQTVGMRRNLARNLEGTVPSVIQLRGGSSSFPIPSVQPHEIPLLIVRGGETMGISVFLIAELGAMHFRSKVVVDFG